MPSMSTVVRDRGFQLSPCSRQCSLCRAEVSVAVRLVQCDEQGMLAELLSHDSVLECSVRYCGMVQGSRAEGLQILASLSSCYRSLLLYGVCCCLLRCISSGVPCSMFCAFHVVFSSHIQILSCHVMSRSRHPLGLYMQPLCVDAGVSTVFVFTM